MSTLANQPAFPKLVSSLQTNTGGGSQLHHTTAGGMTLLQHYAGLAMQSLIRLLPSEYAEQEMQKLGLSEGQTDKLVAKCACDYARALIAELEKINTPAS